MNAIEPIETVEYFYGEVCAFRQYMGDNSWWDKSEQTRDLAISGLTHVYLNLRNDKGGLLDPDVSERVAMVFSSTLNEYERRNFMMQFKM